MAVFQWQGVDTKGKKLRGSRDADNAKALRQLLRREGILVTQLLEASEAKAKSRDIDLGKYFRRVSVIDLAMATRQLATLLQSGIPLVEALAALTEQLEDAALKEALAQTRDRVNEGTSFADALKVHPKIFSHLFIHMVAAGEASGTLEVVLARLADFLENQARLQTKIRGALAYPLFMMLMAVVVVVILMTVVVPKVTVIFSSFDKALPWYTRALIALSELMSSYWWLLLLCVGLGLFLFRRWYASEAGRQRFDRAVLGWPQVGRLLLMVAVARFARTLATLLSSGVPVLRAMEISRNILGNTELQRVIDEARSGVREGESLAAMLKQSRRFPPIVTHMIAIGERSGELETMLEHVANAYETQVDARVVAMTALVEPLIIVTMGIVAGGIVFSVMMPLMQLSDFVE
ncbi:MAG: type II secretion system inner membrane protein GspF [Polyangiales bacterium]